MTIRFYDYAPAPSPRRARMVLAEKGIDHESFQVDMTKNEQLSDDYRKINPNCTIPTVVLEDGTSLFDNFGIAVWAEAYKPDPHLFGTSPTENGLVASWMSKIDQQGAMAFMEAYRNWHRAMKDRAIPGKRNFAQIPELADRGFNRLADFLEDLNERLEGRDYIALDGFSCADIWAFCFIEVTKWIKATPDDRHPNVLSWLETIRARPSATL